MRTDSWYDMSTVVLTVIVTSVHLHMEQTNQSFVVAGYLCTANQLVNYPR